MKSSRFLLVALAGLTLIAGCGKRGGSDGKTVVVDGSDTMVNLSQAWAEAYHKKRPDISVQVSGGGSGVGINSLISGNVQLANASRQMSKSEKDKAKANNGGKEAKEHIVGIDALAVYVHKDNPLDTISIEELAEIYGEGGQITKWSQLGVQNPKGDEIVRVSRQNSSGTYAYFREHVLGHAANGKPRDYRGNMLQQSGSKDVVALVSSSPTAIGYSGMGYKTPGVKWLKVSKKKGETGITPSPDAARDGTYPISRPLFVYTMGEPTGAAKEFLNWCASPEGQKIVEAVGYVPLAK